jgi:site-specific DNA-methyltransferase (adenine-specific)
VILDPFMGSGSTGRGALLGDFGFIGIEDELEYVEIARRRITAISPLFAEVGT